jgi:uncharacterized peroxidase-related enzyme
MAFIETTAPADTTGQAREMIARQQKHLGFVPNYAKIFTDRSDIMDLWASLLRGIRSHIDDRRFELVTFAAAQALGSSYCSLAHGKILREQFLSGADMTSLASGDYAPFTEAESAMMDLARKVVVDSSSVGDDDIDRLRRAGLGENEIFDVVAVASARCFFAKLVDSLGAQPDHPFGAIQDGLRDLLVVGRDVDSEAALEQLPSE